MSKPKLTDKQFFLVINGPSCGGKSSISDLLTETYGGIYKAKNDAIKWLISDYTPKIHQEIITEMIQETIRVALSHGLSVVKEALWHPEPYIKLAKKMKIPLIVANVTAPWEVLEVRFQERVEAKKQGAKISNVSPERFKELFDLYESTRMKTTLEFDSSKQSPEEIVKKIVSYIKKAK